MDKDKLINEYVNSHIAEAIKLLETLGKIPAPSYKEDRRAEFCLKWFQEQGAENTWIAEAKNVICTMDCDKFDDIVVFMAHTDIVFPDMKELTMKREGNRLYAPGIGDDTANLVNLMMSAKYFLNKKSCMKKGIMFVANSCEEGLGNLSGCKEVFNKYGDRINEFYSIDGYLSQCTSTPVGSHRYKISAKSEGGHSYLDYGNENAINVISSIIQGFDKIVLPDEEKTTQNVGYIEGGTTVNSIPQEASMLYEYRSSSQKCLMEMEEVVTNLISGIKNEGKNISVELMGVRPGKGEMDEESFNVWTENNISTIKKYFDGPIDTQPYSTDANVPLSIGVLANTIGTISGADAHKREEWVDLDSVPVGMKIVFSLMLKYVK